MEYRVFGKNGFQVPVIGFGAGHIGGNDVTEAEVDTLLNSALDEGITLIDTARAYGASEERIGRYLCHRRHDFILSTKIGYGIQGHEDWTYGCIVAGIDYALRLLQTDYIDIVHLHSCPLWLLQQGVVTSALCAARDSGKIRVAAYSGENEELGFAINSGAFDSVQTSMSLFDQRSARWYASEAIRRRMGIIAKRPIGNCAWKFAERPAGQYAEEYWARMKEMELDFGDAWLETALRYTAFHTGAHSMIIGTGKLSHLQDNIRLLEAGPLAEDTLNLINAKFGAHEAEWGGQV
jgi:aryl-alcohol dehydrogenase-like predicted oxidoreductase